jgi:hypothetical protein
MPAHKMVLRVEIVGETYKAVDRYADAIEEISEQPPSVVSGRATMTLLRYEESVVLTDAEYAAALAEYEARMAEQRGDADEEA